MPIHRWLWSIISKWILPSANSSSNRPRLSGRSVTLPLQIVLSLIVQSLTSHELNEHKRHAETERKRESAVNDPPLPIHFNLPAVYRALSSKTHFLVAVVANNPAIVRFKAGEII